MYKDSTSFIYKFVGSALKLKVSMVMFFDETNMYIHICIKCDVMLILSVDCKLFIMLIVKKNRMCFNAFTAHKIDHIEYTLRYGRGYLK